MLKLADITSDVNVEQRGPTTLVTITLGPLEAQGMSRCKEGDAFDPLIGIDLALGRAMQELGKAVEANAEGLVVTERQAQRVVDSLIEGELGG